MNTWHLQFAATTFHSLKLKPFHWVPNVRCPPFLWICQCHQPPLHSLQQLFEKAHVFFLRRACAQAEKSPLLQEISQVLGERATKNCVQMFQGRFRTWWRCNLSREETTLKVLDLHGDAVFGETGLIWAELHGIETFIFRQVWLDVNCCHDRKWVFGIFQLGCKNYSSTFEPKWVS